MWRVLFTRLAAAVPVALAVSFLSFMLVHIAPGDPVSAIAPGDASVEVLAQLRAKYHLDQPVVVQYGHWLARAAVGDLGASLANGRPVVDEIGTAFFNTAALAAFAAIVALVSGSLGGMAAGLTLGSKLDRCVTTVFTAAFAVPSYWLGIVLVLVFSVWLGVLPGVGLSPDAFAGGPFTADALSALVLPGVTLSLIPAGVIARAWRASIAEIRHQEFVTALRLRGLAEHRVALHTVLNALPGVLPVIGVQVGYLLGGSILVEVVFNWPGTGLLLNSAIFQRDIAVLQGVVLVLGMVFVLINLLVDLLQVLVDPRIRRT